MTDTRVWNHHGRVVVGRTVIADTAGWWSYSMHMEPTRERTPDEWWLRAYEIEEAEAVSNTAGPLGLGVDFFADDYWLAVPPEVRDSIQEEAYEAAREVIVARLDEHLAQMRHALRGDQ